MKHLTSYKGWGKVIPNFHTLVCGPCAHTGNCKLPACCTRTWPYDCPFPAGFSHVSVSAVLEKNLTGGCQRLKTMWKVVQVWLRLLQQWREIFLRLGHWHPIHLHWTGDFSTVISSESPGKVTADKHKTIYGDATLPRDLKWSRKTVVFHTHVGSTDWLLQFPLGVQECSNWFCGVLCTNGHYKELEGIKCPAPSTVFGCTFLLNLSFQAYLSLIEVSVHEKWKAGTAFG